MPGDRRLFVYWRLGRADLAGALHAARALQHTLRQQHPGLHAGLLLRGDDTGLDEATLMETYAHDAGVDAALQAAIEAAAAEALRRFVRGRRHVEVFDAV